MDYLKLAEILGTVGLTILGIYIKDIVAKATLSHRVHILEEIVRDLKVEMKSLNDTMSQTNQFLSSTHTAVKGLEKWLERTENRLSNL